MSENKKQIAAFEKTFGKIGEIYQEDDWLARLGVFICGWLAHEEGGIMITLWIVGKVTEYNYAEWEFVGLYATEASAVARCTSQYHFVAPANVNEYIPEERRVWTGAYYPMTKCDD